MNSSMIFDPVIWGQSKAASRAAQIRGQSKNSAYPAMMVSSSVFTLAKDYSGALVGGVV